MSDQNCKGCESLPPRRFGVAMRGFFVYCAAALAGALFYYNHVRDFLVRDTVEPPTFTLPSRVTAPSRVDIPVEWFSCSPDDRKKERQSEEDAQQQAGEAEAAAHHALDEVRQWEQVHQDVNRLIQQQRQIEEFNRDFQRDWNRLQDQQRSFEFSDPPVSIRY